VLEAAAEVIAGETNPRYRFASGSAVVHRDSIINLKNKLK